MNESASRLPDLGPAPEFAGILLWLNTGEAPLHLAGLGGRVVLLEFWAVACGNCVRTLPFMREMHQRYAPELAVIGIHTPELPGERRPATVERAARERRLTYPIGLDNDFATWHRYGTEFWPTLHLIDPSGHLRYSHVGEGAYRRTEAAIRALL